jgi:hypothetical protein
MNYYTGIGSRETPPDICEFFTRFAVWLAEQQWVLRSGAAQRADAAFEAELPGWAGREIYLPWLGFNDHRSHLAAYSVEHRAIAAQHHPAWHRLSEPARRMHTRNVAQIFGMDFQSPSKFVVCWTKDGKASGGTGQAIRIAEAYNIPVFNMKRDGDYDKLLEFLSRFHRVQTTWGA